MQFRLMNISVIENMDTIGQFFCEKPVLYQNDVLNLLWDIKKASRFTLEYVDQGALLRLDSDLQDLPLSGKKRIEGLEQDTLFTLTSYDKNTMVFQQQIRVQVLHTARPSLDIDQARAFIIKSKVAGQSNANILSDAVSRLNIDIFTADNVLCIASILNDNGAENWLLFNDITLLLAPAYKDCLALNKMLEHIATKLKLYSSLNMLEFIKGLDARCLTLGSKSDLDAVICQILKPVLQRFSNENQFYWYHCVVMAFKSLSVDEQLVSRVLHKFFRNNNWEYEIKYGALLTLIFHVSDDQSHDEVIQKSKMSAVLSPKAMLAANAEDASNGVLPEASDQPTNGLLNKEEKIESDIENVIAVKKLAAMDDNIVSELKKIGIESLIASRPGRLLADYQKEMYEQYFSHLVDKFPCLSQESMSQWAMNMAQGLKSSGVGQITALFCFEKYITARGWEFDLDLSEKLIELYQFTVTGAH